MSCTVQEEYRKKLNGSTEAPSTLDSLVVDLHSEADTWTEIRAINDAQFNFQQSHC